MYNSVGHFVDGQIAVPVSAANLNQMDQGILDASNRLTTLEGNSATLTDLMVARSVNLTSLTAGSGGGSFRILVAPFPLQILSVSIVTSSTLALSADDTNYWTIDLRKGISSSFGTKTNKLTGGVAWTADVDVNYDSITFDPTNSVFAKGNVFKVYITTTGTPAAAFPTCDITARYKPL